MAKKNPWSAALLLARAAARNKGGTGQNLTAANNPKIRLAKSLNKHRAADTSGVGPGGNTGGGGGGGGGAVAAPVSTLAGLPQSALLDTLIANGLIKEGMPAEQALAVLKFAQLREGVPINVAELMKLVEGDYEKTTGDILTSGQDWMEQLMGTAYDPNDPNARMFADDPIFSDYAGGLAQMDETADTNLATDLAWFRKNQEAQEQYYNDMMTSISTGALPIGAAAAATGGGGGGGGGGYGGGGYGGGGGGGSSDVKSTLASTAEEVNTTNDTSYLNFPGFTDAIMKALEIENPLVADRIESILNLGSDPKELLPALEEEQMAIDAANEEYREIVGPGDLVGSNELWRPRQPGELNEMIERYEDLTGMSLGSTQENPNEYFTYRPGDNPATLDEVETDWVPTIGGSRGALNAADAAELTQLEEFLIPALQAAAPQGNIGNPEDMTGAYNAISYVRDLANKRLAQPKEELPEDFMSGLRNKFGGPQRIPANQQSSAAGNYTSGGWVPSIVADNTDPNVGPHIPMGTEVPITPDAISEYYEQTGSMPMTPLTDDPNAQPIIPPGALPTGGGNSGAIPPAGTPEYQQYLAQVQLNGNLEHAAIPYTPNILADPRMQRNVMDPTIKLNAAIQAGLTPQQAEPTDSQKIQQLLSQFGTEEDETAALRQAAAQKVARQVQQAANPTAEGWMEAFTGRSGEDYRNAAENIGYTSEGAASANYVDPAAIRQRFIDRLVLDPEGSGNLIAPVEDIFRKKSGLEWEERTEGMDPEAANAIINQGEYWRDPRLTPEEYIENEAVAERIPTLIELTRQFHPNWTMTQVYAKVNEMRKEGETFKQTSYNRTPEVALQGATGQTLENGWEDVNPIELAPEAADYSSEVSLGMPGAGVGIHGAEVRLPGIRNRVPGGLDIGTLLKNSAKQLNLPATVAAQPKPYTPNWSNRLGGKQLANVKTGGKQMANVKRSPSSTAASGARKLALLANLANNRKRKR